MIGKKTIAAGSGTERRRDKKVPAPDGVKSRFRDAMTSITRKGNNVRRRVGALASEFIDIDELEETFRQVSTLVSIMEPIKDSRSPWTITKVAIGLGKYFIETPDPGSADEYFDYETRGWDRTFSGQLAQIIFESLHPVGELVKASKFSTPGRDSHDEDDIVEAHATSGAYVGVIPVLPHIKVGWLCGYAGEVETIWIHEPTPTSYDEILQAASDAFWNSRKTKHLVLRVANTRNRDDGKAAGLIDDHTREIHRSKLSDDLVVRSKRFMDAGVNRTIMLFGPPGTGKSTAAQRLIVDLDIRSLRLPVETIHELDSDDLDTIFKVVRPEAVIMDDFDRCREQDTLLENLEKMRASVNLVVATVNDLDRLDEALLRPGRFDELTEVDHLDEVAIRNILGEFADDSIDLVRSWPVAFIEEYIRRRRVMGLSALEARETMVELAARVKRMRRKHTRGLSFDEELNILAKSPDAVVPILHEEEEEEEE